MKHVIDRKELDAIATYLEDELADRGIYIQIERIVDWKIQYTLEGDWKHDHLRSQYVIDDVLKQIGLVSLEEGCEVTKDTGSDWYGARYWIAIIKKE